MPQNSFIEHLSEASTVGEFFTLADKQLSLRLDSLVERVFRQPNFALKSVVDSLFEHQGPLAERSVKLKLLLGLGVISAEQYQDLALIFEQSPQLTEIDSFAETSVLSLIDKLHCADSTPINKLLEQRPKLDDSLAMQRQMQQLRLERMVRSSLILAIVEILEGLEWENLI